MYTILTNRRDNQDRDEGFTLIELMVVVLIIAILLAIAIPTFLGAQTKAKDRGAQSSARIALTNAKTIYADTGNYTLATAGELGAIEPGMAFVTGDVESAGPKSVSVAPSATTNATAWTAAVLSESGTCFYIKDSIATGAGSGTSYFKNEAPTTGQCDASEAVTYDADGWD